MESLCKIEAEHVVKGILADVLEKVTSEASGTVEGLGSVREEAKGQQVSFKLSNDCI